MNAIDPVDVTKSTIYLSQVYLPSRPVNSCLKTEYEDSRPLYGPHEMEGFILYDKR